MQERKRALHALYTQYSKSSESNTTSCLLHVTQFSSDFERCFHDFTIDSVRTLIPYHILLAFSLDIALSFACT